MAGSQTLAQLIDIAVWYAIWQTKKATFLLWIVWHFTTYSNEWPIPNNFTFKTQFQSYNASLNALNIYIIDTDITDNNKTATDIAKRNVMEERVKQ